MDYQLRPVQVHISQLTHDDTVAIKEEITSPAPMKLEHNQNNRDSSSESTQWPGPQAA